MKKGNKRQRLQFFVFANAGTQYILQKKSPKKSPLKKNTSIVWPSKQTVLCLTPVKSPIETPMSSCRFAAR